MAIMFSASAMYPATHSWHYGSAHPVTGNLQAGSVSIPILQIRKLVGQITGKESEAVI